MADIESKILARELGKLGGAGAKRVARFLPSVPCETALDVPASPADVQATGLSVLREIGRADPELPELSVICGSGRLNLNPTIVSLTIVPRDGGARVSVRGNCQGRAVETRFSSESSRASERVVAETICLTMRCSEPGGSVVVAVVASRAPGR